MSRNNNTSAFPTLTWDQIESGQIIQMTGESGLTKRELIAAMAMQGLLAGRWASAEPVDCSPEKISELATDHADALLAELSKS